MKYSKNDLQKVLLGSSVLGTGGGGRYELAEKILGVITSPVNIIPIGDVADDEIVITAFMVGSLGKKGDIEKVIINTVNKLSQLLQKQIKYILPVEIGPTATMSVFNIASKLGLSVIDGDIVGYRSSPEIYLETITMTNGNRLPIVASNVEGDTIALYETSSIEKVESILRTFSSQSQSEVYVAGYPLFKRDLINSFGKGSVSFAREIGEILEKVTNEKRMIDLFKKNGCKFIDKGEIITQDENEKNGFTSGELLIRSKENNYRILYRNEYLILFKNDEVSITCPDSIYLIDQNTRKGINNSEKNKGKKVFIFGRRAIDIWRTRKGKRLFSPKNLGLPYRQVLLR